MTARQPRRARRRNVPSESLPRLRPGDGTRESSAPTSTTRANQRVHHVTDDYSYVRSDMVLVGIFSAVTLGFIIVMNFIL
jgi:hypothetical protein